MPYKDPVKKRENQRERRRRYKERHPERLRDAHRRWCERNRDRKNELQRGYVDRHRENVNRAQSEDYHGCRLALFSILGFVCVGCGCVDHRVLEFDHVHNDGGEDRRRFNGMRSFYVHYAKHPEEAASKLQVLCRNCNWLKRRGELLPLQECDSPRPKSGGRILDGRTWDEYPS